MRLIDRLLGTGQPRSAEGPADATLDEDRKALAAMALRDVLERHGLAPACVRADLFPATTSRGRRAHVQLVVREWEPRVLAYVVSLQASVRARLQMLDPQASSWLMGLSWKFEAGDARWPRLSDTQGAAAVATATPPAGSARGALDRMLDAGDALFAPARGAHEDFVPTVPLPAHDARA